MCFNVVVPRRKVAVANRPVNSDALLRVGLKVVIAPAITLAPPGQRAAAYLIASIPVEAFYFRVGRVFLVYPEGEVFLIEQVPLEYGVGLLHGIRSAASMQVFPGRLGGVDVILDMLDIAAPLEEQNP